MNITTEYSRPGVDIHRHSNYNKTDHKENIPMKISSFFPGPFNNITPISNILVGKNYDNMYFYQNFLLKITDEKKETDETGVKVHTRHGGHNDSGKNNPLKTVHSMKCSKDKIRSINKLKSDKRDPYKNTTKKIKEDNRDKEESFDYKSKNKKITAQVYKPIGILTPVSNNRNTNQWNSNSNGYNNNISPEKAKFKDKDKAQEVVPFSEQKKCGFISQFLQIQRLNSIEELGKKINIFKEELSTNNNNEIENEIGINSKESHKFKVDNDIIIIDQNNEYNLIDKVNKSIIFKKNSEQKRSHNISFDKEQFNNKENNQIIRSNIKGNTTIIQNKKKKRFFCCLPIA